MTYRPTEFEVENHTGVPLDIRLNAECQEDEGGNVWFEVSQDCHSVVVSLGALEMLVDAANELLAGWRENKSIAEHARVPRAHTDGGEP